MGAVSGSAEKERGCTARICRTADACKPECAEQASHEGSRASQARPQKGELNIHLCYSLTQSIRIAFMSPAKLWACSTDGLMLWACRVYLEWTSTSLWAQQEAYLQNCRHLRRAGTLTLPDRSSQVGCPQAAKHYAISCRMCIIRSLSRSTGMCVLLSASLRYRNRALPGRLTVCYWDCPPHQAQHPALE